MNGQKLTNLADPSSAQDAVTKQYAEQAFYANTTTLDQIEAPTASVSMNSQKITDVLPGTLSSDVMTLGQSSSLAFGVMYAANTISSISYPFAVPFTAVFKPTVPTGATEVVTLPQDGVLKVAVSGTYKIDV
jgi:hypothetical protein